MDRPSKPNWAYWLNMADVELSAAVELSVDVTPGWFSRTDGERFIRADQERLYQEIATRTKVVRSHARSGTLRAMQRSDRTNVFPFTGDPYEVVNLADFRAWGESLPHPLTFPPEFPKAPCEQDTTGETEAAKWPWGTHETKLLRQLDAAARRFWVNYDPNEPDTAPTNAVVIDWLKKRGVADRVAEVMAQMLRADGLRTGRR